MIASTEGTMHLRAGIRVSLGVVQHVIRFLAALFLAVQLSGCEEKVTSGKGLHLPPGSIIEAGCVLCHTVHGTDLASTPENPPLFLELGGEVRRVSTYGELITSIINPDHVISPEYLKQLTSTDAEGGESSPMPSFAEAITVAELIDLVTFLDSRYEKAIPEYVGYGMHYMPY